ncbi:pentapeptide repeat-containing protein [Henriciella litoralis]|uniref:pentapeptide repeat-containing protein n=1 Tax=Henriciella litoralis TaxID=568102 RepID=UPI00146D4B04|nr:pentapeptide repeat-containing protein [Henriciella litoralis]
MSKPKDLQDWLGLKKSTDYAAVAWLGPIVCALAILLLLTGVAMIIATIFLLFITMLGAEVDLGINRSEGIRNYGLVLAALLGAPFIVWRSVVAAEQSKTAAEALFNDKVNSAAQGLVSRHQVSCKDITSGERYVEWQDDLVARSAAIDRLEGLAFERPDASVRVVRLLANYVRGNFPCLSKQPTPNFASRPLPRMDMERAIASIGRVLPLAAQYDSSEWRLDLKDCNFDGVHFSEGCFRAVNFGRSRFEGAVLASANFEGCIFVDCLLNFADFRRANFRGANMDRIVLEKCNGVFGFAGADIEGVTFVGANLLGLSYLGPKNVVQKTFGNADTKVSAPVSRRMLNSTDWNEAHLFMHFAEDDELDTHNRDLVNRLKQSGFLHWAPYSSDDLALGEMINKFYKELNMNVWPYWEYG